MSSDGSLLGSYYPVEPYNFDVPPPQYLIGPIRSILEVVQTRLVQIFADITTVQMQVSVQNASGVYLDAHGVFYSTPRLPGEPDDAYRPRMLEALTAGKITIHALQVMLDNYLASTTATEGQLAGGVVYDLRSNPTACAEDAVAGYTAQRGDFIIEVGRSLSEDDAFFVDYTPLDYETYLFNAGTSYTGQTDDPELARRINEIKAGGTNAVFKTVVTFTA